ncbi:Fic family protein [Clostridium sp. AUH-JLR23]|uniref:Fic family protein n=1 Tax=Clostridium sp. AUH-JLR23 TaxID=1505062 RepID=UPI0035660506
MKYLSVSQIAKKWNLSERTVRNYCAQGRIDGAFITGKTWNIPENAMKPERKPRQRNKQQSLLDILQREKASHLSGGIYHRIQIDLTYNSNHIEGSQLNHDQTRYIFETHTIGVSKEAINVDDIIETTNHFRCIDMIIEEAHYQLSETFIKKLHKMLKVGTLDSQKDWFQVGDYKIIPNEVGGQETTLPENVSLEIKQLLYSYNHLKNVSLDDILDFHVKFEKIHPFQDGNGRIGRLIMFKECLKHHIVPFIITEELKWFYYRGIKEWYREKGFFRDTCLTAQDAMKKSLDYFRISYNK